MLSLEGFEMDEESETDEEADQVRPLQPLRITIADRSTSPDSTSLKTGSSVDSAIITPTSATAVQVGGYDSSPEKTVVRLAGSSPSRKAPIGSGPGLDRKESKWRKSVMGISDVSLPPCHESTRSVLRSVIGRYGLSKTYYPSTTLIA